MLLLLFLSLLSGAPQLSDCAAAAAAAQLGYSSSVRSVCKPIPSTLSLCHGIGYRHMRIPNLLGHDTLREAQQQSAAWLPLVSKLCHRDTRKFLCSLFAPVCLPELSGPVSPCRSLCEAVRDGCVPVMSAFGFPWPEMFNCSRFPSRTELCIPVTGEQEARAAEEARQEEALKGRWGSLTKFYLAFLVCNIPPFQLNIVICEVNIRIKVVNTTFSQFNAIYSLFCKYS